MSCLVEDMVILFLAVRSLLIIIVGSTFKLLLAFVILTILNVEISVSQRLILFLLVLLFFVLLFFLF
ncbi:hypothetical protein BCV69DRAFT_284146 [Microstroma glucosiphilum]|uniref:Uncharacterized protein n=1 Tax=Pseudomicrostroma glucosiphilum TaxID=1684307 RepID=A0A316U2F8_9BASI|nr:hypothetical protein BCV69DRAFT_284146 [Pseudomicrostroma glucosiphilum]PWN19519.1 hypothetical protein BCV69DRAFT_284146 [Pseudomicrostroma glucosiphilum]